MQYLGSLSRFFNGPSKRRKLIAQSVLWSDQSAPRYQGRITQIHTAEGDTWDADKFILHYLETHDFDSTATNCNELAKWMEVYPSKESVDLDKLTKWLEVRA